MRPSRSVQRLSSAVGTAVLGLVAVAALAGCQPPPKRMAPPPAPPSVPTAEQTMSVQQQFAAADPKAKVGHVAGVKADQHLAAVGGIAFSDVKVGDPIAFAGSDQQPFANGTIIDLDNHTDPSHPLLIVDYQKASTNGRDPTVADFAILVQMGR